MERHFWKIFAAIVGTQLVLAYGFPITSDEAYFYTWAANLDVNYYDHPPMVAWLIWLFSHFGRHVFFYRLIAVITGVIVALGILVVARDLLKAPEKARLLSLVYLTAPLHVLFIPISTDTPLFLFTFLAGTFFAWGLFREKPGVMFLAGLFLSMAILSKYFAGLMIFGMAAVLLFQHRRRSLTWILLLAAGAAPLGLLHLYWNYEDCWRTLMFNVFNRNKDHSLSLVTFARFLGFQVYLATPWVLYYMARNIRPMVRGIRSDRNPFFWLAAVPVGMLGGLAVFDSSLHWTLSFYPFIFLLLVYLTPEVLSRIVRYSALFSAVHAAVLLAVLVLPLQWASHHRYYGDIVMGFHGDEIYRRLRAESATAVLATPGYTTAALMSYHSGEHFAVFNDDDRNGRNDDKVTDYRKLDGKDFLILSTLAVKPNELIDYERYFDAFEVDSLEVRGARYSVVRGKGFRYEAYRQGHLKKILQDCYRIPGFLPVGDCFFYDRYFPGGKP